MGSLMAITLSLLISNYDPGPCYDIQWTTRGTRMVRVECSPLYVYQPAPKAREQKRVRPEYVRTRPLEFRPREV